MGQFSMEISGHAGSVLSGNQHIPYHFTQDSSLENCQVLCVPCHRGVGGKTADDQRDISKAKRIWLKHTGAWPASKAKIHSGGFRKTRDV